MRVKTSRATVTIIDDRYEVLECLGEGGTGAVLKARELGLERTVAIKLLHAELIGDDEDRLRFQREGEILSTLSHPNILKFYRFGIWGNSFPYIAMEFLQGTTLRKAITDTGRLEPKRSAEIAIQVCHALSEAHAQGIVHRDISPANVMLTTDGATEQAKLIDFGLSRVVTERGQRSQHLTQTGTLIGSVYYMSPEQCLGKKVDHLSDIYSLGCVLYEILTGEPPHQAETPVGLMHKHVTETPCAIEETGQFPEGMSAVVSTLWLMLPCNPRIARREPWYSPCSAVG